MKPLSLLEEQAARIVAALSDCVCKQLDPGGGSDQLPDFEIRNSSNERIGVLEVTSTVAGEIAAFRSAQPKNRISCDQLHFRWFIVMRSADAKLKVLRKTLPPLLVQAEQQGFLPPSPMELVPGFNFLDGDEPQTSLSSEGVWMLCARAAQGSQRGTVHVEPPAQGGGIGLEMVTVSVEAELGKADNLAKLTTALDGERSELFVWLDEGTAGMALVTPRLLPSTRAASRRTALDSPLP